MKMSSNMITLIYSTYIFRYTLLFLSFIYIFILQFSQTCHLSSDSVAISHVVWGKNAFFSMLTRVVRSPEELSLGWKYPRKSLMDTHQDRGDWELRSLRVFHLESWSVEHYKPQNMCFLEKKLLNSHYIYISIYIYPIFRGYVSLRDGISVALDQFHIAYLHPLAMCLFRIRGSQMSRWLHNGVSVYL